MSKSKTISVNVKTVKPWLQKLTHLWGEINSFDINYSLCLKDIACKIAYSIGADQVSLIPDNIWRT